LIGGRVTCSAGDPADWFHQQDLELGGLHELGT
jgi:hypothetical protein